MRIFLLIVSIAASGVLAGCASQPGSLRPIGSTQGSTVVQKVYVTEVRDITFNDDRHSAIGSIVGAVLGGIAGSTIGAGNGRTLAAIGGATVGGIAGQQLGKASSTKSSIRLTVRSEDGALSTYDIAPNEIFRVGDLVKIITTNGNVTVVH